MRSAWRLITPIFFAVLACGCHHGRPDISPSICSVELGSPERLASQDRRNVYVEPAAYAWSGGELLVAGRPTVLWRGEATFTADSVIGVVVQSNAELRLLESPIALPLVGTWKAIGRPRGGWDVIIAERTSPTARDSIAKLWHGVYDGRRWTSLTQIPIASGIQPLPVGSSNINRLGDSLSWAVRVRNPAEHTTDVLVLRFRAGQWSSELVSTRRVSYVALNEFAGGSQLAVVGPDFTEARDDNSLFIWTDHPSWKMRRRISLGDREGPAHHPTLVGSDQPVLTWYVDSGPARELRALDDPLKKPLDEVVTIDSSFADLGAAGSIRLPQGHHLWVSHHIAPTDARHLRFVLSSPGRSPTAQTFPSPYATSIRALAADSSKLLLIGAVQDQVSNGYQTMLVRARVVCSQ